MRLASRAVTATALALALSGPALAAHAQGTSWGTLVTFDGAKVQACKVPTTAQGPWKVKLRVNARQATARVRGNAVVIKGSTATSQTWASGWVPRGQVSTVGSVRLPRGSAYSLNVGLSASQAGNGGAFHAGQIRAC